MAAVATSPLAVRPGLFDHKLPPRLIVGSFFVLTLPLVALFALTSNHFFVSLYIWLFGLTHFVLTISIYLQSGNLKHFTATPRNIVLYFVLPLAILMGFYVVGVLQLNARLPMLAIVFSVTIRALDFNHLDRQSYGVYQMFKARTGLRPSALVRNCEQAYFYCLTALMLTSFLAGGACPLPQVRGWSLSGSISVRSVSAFGDALVPMAVLQTMFVVLAGLATVLGVLSVILLLRAWRAADRPAGLVEALGYFGVQTASACFAILSIPLYFATLAIHYVEYHVLMYPRCFHSELNKKSGLDRWFASLRRSRVVFYGVIVAAAGLVLVVRTVGAAPGLPVSYRAVTSIFDGLFVFHYVVEMMIWRFSNPFFRKTLAPLYFVPRPRTS